MGKQELVEPEAQYRLRKNRLFINTSIRTVFSAMVILFIAWLMELWNRTRDPNDASEFGAMCLGSVLIIVAIPYFFLRPTGIRLMECLRLRPIKLAWTSITLNARYSVDVKQIGNISRNTFWNELEFTLTKPKAVVIINDTDFVREVLRKHKDLWHQWAYSENELPFW